MREKIRKSGIEVIGNLPWGSHVCQLYRTREELFEILAAYYKAGLESNECCIYILPETISNQEFNEYLSRKIPQFKDFLNKRQIEVIPSPDWYLEGGNFDSQRVIRNWLVKLDTALSEGFEGLRISGNANRVKQNNLKEYMAYETGIHDIIARNRILALCSFSLETCTSADIADMISTHELALLKRGTTWSVVENSSYKKARKALEESEVKYHTLFDNMTEGFVLLEPLLNDNNQPYDYRVLEINKAGENLMNISRKVVSGKTMLEIAPRYEPQWREFLNGIVLSGQSAQIDQYVGYMKKWLEIYAYSPRPGLVAVIMKEITARKKIEEELRESRDRYISQKRVLETITSNTDAQLALLDPDFNFIFVNPAYEKGCGYSKEDLIGKNHFDLFPNEENLVLFKQVRDKGVPVIFKDKPFEYAAQPERGTTYWNWMLTPVKNTAGGVEGLVLSLVDVTERKLSEQSLQKYARELENANNELEAFSYSVSHDLRAPLRALDGFSLAIIQDYEDKLDNEGRDYLGRIRQASQTMSKLIDDILRLSRIGRAEMHLDAVDLSLMVKSISEDLKSSQPERQAQFNIAPGVNAWGDLYLLQIAMKNLLENAWKFTRKNRQTIIEFGVTEQAGKQAYFIKDNGVGFDLRYADKIFQPFQRLHSDRDYEGTGIGLAIIQRIVRRHGGNVWAESEPGEGATFSFTLGQV
jgi:PAS domain S-box-containing protein